MHPIVRKLKSFSPIQAPKRSNQVLSSLPVPHHRFVRQILCGPKVTTVTMTMMILIDPIRLHSLQ